MKQRSEEVKVGIFVVATIAMLILVLAVVGGLNVTRRPQVNYMAKFKFAGGIEPGAPVRFAGLKVGRVERAQIDPQDPTRVRVQLSIRAGTPVHTDSVARIATLGLLGENYIEVSPGTATAAALASGSELKVQETAQFAELVNQMSAVMGDAQGLVKDLRANVNQISGKADELLVNLNKVTDEENRKHLHSVLHESDQMLAKTRPRVESITKNADESTAKVKQLLDDIQGTRKRADDLLANLNNLVQQDTGDLRQSIVHLRDTMARAEKLVTEMQNLLRANRDNLDEVLENFRTSSENFREFTDQIKQRPYSLIRVKNPPKRQPGDAE